jgi:hypothetical protein
MINEYKHLTDGMVLKLWERAIIAYRDTHGISMPVNDRNYLLHRKLLLRDECVRRGLISTYPL